MPYASAADGCRIHYRVTGRSSAPPLLMIQGLGMDKHGWDIQRFVFSLRYRVIALDNRGAGRSDKPVGDYDLNQMAADAVYVDTTRLSADEVFERVLALVSRG